jgi:RNA 3'-terminal phosphate cyclase (ATP)
MTVEIDGRYGEGGGQILRTALALSMVAGVPVHITHVREGRPKPGLAAQHLAAVRAAAALSGASVSGAELRSTELFFAPRRRAAAGEYRFDIGEQLKGGSAGSVTLLLHALLPPLALADGRSRLVLRGGTHVPWSPPYDYVEQVWLPVLAAAGIRADVTLKAWGWFPAGGGEVACTIEGNGGAPLQPVDLRERGELLRITGRAVTARLLEHISERMARRAAEELGSLGLPAVVEPLRVPGSGPGAGIFLTAHYQNVAAGFSSVGERGKPAELVAEGAVAALLEHHRAGAAVDEHLADQLLVPLALAGGVSRFTTPLVSGHLETNAWVIRQFGQAETAFETTPGGTVAVTVTPLVTRPRPVRTKTTEV